MDGKKGFWIAIINHNPLFVEQFRRLANTAATAWFLQYICGTLLELFVTIIQVAKCVLYMWVKFHESEWSQEL